MSGHTVQYSRFGLTTLKTIWLLWLLSGCATSSIKPVTTFQEPGYENAAYRDALIIGVAGSYDSRATFERHMASTLSDSGIKGTAYYSVIGRNKEITRSDVSDAVRARGFDSVILTRIVSQESNVSEKRGASTATASRRDSEPVIDLFRYDYEVLNNPSTINVASTVVLSTEVFSAVDEKRVFAMQTTISDEENVRLLLEEAVEKIVAHLRKEGVVGK
jgi:hypothetical protein